MRRASSTRPDPLSSGPNEGVTIRTIGANSNARIQRSDEIAPGRVMVSM